MKKVSKILQISLFLIFGLALTIVEVAAQCGADGTQPCPKISPSPEVNKVAPAATAKQRAERLERQRAEQARLKRKQLEGQSAKNPPAWLKNVIEYSKTVKNNRLVELFPVANVTLGKTGSKLLSLTGENCGIVGKDGRFTECYVVEGITFYCDENFLSDSLYLNKLRFQGMPENWRQLGFDWNLSYTGWTNLFKQLGYETLATQKPVVAAQDGKRFLRGELMTVVNTSAGRAQIVLNFDFGIGKTTVNDPGTLFSISIDKFN